MVKKKILLVGESWSTNLLEIKGCDFFAIGGYGEGREYLFDTLSDSYDVEYMPSQKVPASFPTELEALKKYDAIILSDIGANSFLLNPKTFFEYKPTPNRLKLLARYVEEGGGLCMVGGYMSFMGIEGKAFYKDTIMEEILPVNLLERDDRVEIPEGVNIHVDPDSHPILSGLPTEWPNIFGYNRLIAKKEATVVVKNGKDPIIVLGSFGNGRTLAFATDCAPHWASLEFCESECYKRLWKNITGWLTKEL